MDEDDEDEFTMLMRKIRRMLYKGKLSNHRKSKWQGKGERKKEEVGPCYQYKKQRRLIADCPNLKATTSKRTPKKKVMMASWDED